MKKRSSLLPNFALACSMVLTCASSTFAASGTWNYDGTAATSNTWNASGSWTGGIPNGVGESATFSKDITAARSITLDGDKTVGSLTIGDPTTSFFGYTIGSTAQAFYRLTFDQPGTANAILNFPQIANNTAANTVNALIQLNDNLVIDSQAANASNPTQTLSGIITGGKSVTKSGPGLITLSGLNSYSGGTTLSGGKITASTISSFGSGTVSVASGAQANLSATGVYPNHFAIAGNGLTLSTAEANTANLVGALRFGNSVTSGTITIDSAGARLGAISGAYGILLGPLAGSGPLEINSITSTHAGVITLNGDASAYTGTITVPLGTLKLGTVAIGGNLVMRDGTTLFLNNALTNDTSPVIGTVSVPKSLTLGNSGSTTTGVALYVDPATTNPPAIRGDVTLNGTNTVYLTNACAGTPVTLLTYTGTLTGSASNLALAVPSGYRGATFAVDNASSPKKITLTMASNSLTWSGSVSGNWNATDSNWGAGGTFMNGDNVTFDDSASGSGAVTVAIPTSGVVAPNSITVNNPTRSYTVNGAGRIAGAASLTKDGAGTLTVANTTANTFTGGITLKNGTLAMSTAGFGTATFLKMTGGAFTASSTTAMTGNANANLSGNIVLGDGTNTGAITLTGNHSFANNTSISVPVRASVTLTGNNLLPANLTVSTPFSTSFNANLILGGSSILSANTTITNTGVYNSSNSITFSGPLTDGASSFSLTKEGIGRLTLSAANTYDGGTLVNNGLVYANNALSFGTGSVTVANGAQALLAGSGVIPNAFSISGTGLTLPGLNNTSPDGAINLNTSNQFLTGAITLSSDARIAGYFTASGFITGVIDDGPGSFALDLGSPGAANGCGTLTLTGTNTYNGGTNIYRTILRAYSNGAFGSGDVTIGSGSDAPTIGLNTRLEVGAGITLPNNLNLNCNGRTNSTAATQTWGVITGYPGDATTPSTAIVSGSVNITNTPSNGGHFAVQGLATNILRVTGQITSSVPVIVSNGIVELGGGGTDYSELQQWRDTLRVTATDGIATSAVVSQGAQGTAVLDLNGYDQTLAGLTRPTGTNAVSVTNNKSGAPAKLTLIPGTSFTYPGTFVTDPAGSALNLSIGGFGSEITTLSGTSTSFSGTTTVTNGGTLNLTGTLGNGSSSLVTQSGSRLQGKGTFGGNVALGGGTTIDVNPAVAGNLTAGGSINVTGTVSVNLTSPPTGPVVVMSCTGTLTATAGNFTAPGYPTAAFSVVGKQVLVSVSSENLTWTGVGGSQWDLNSTSNWTDGSTARKFLNGYGATFSDSPGSNQEIQIPGQVQPSSMTFTNATRSYTFTDSSAGLIQAGSLTKGGAGKVTFSVPVSFSGGIALNAGIVAIESSEVGSPITLSSSLSGAGTLAIAAGYGNPITVSGANSAFSGQLSVTKGEMILSGAAPSGTAQIAIGDSSSLDSDEPKLTLASSVSVSNPVVASSPALISRIAGPGVISGSGSLLKDGSGTLEVSNANSYTGTTTIVAGTLKGMTPNAIPAASTILMGTAATGASDTVLVLPPAVTSYQTTLSSPIVLGNAPASNAILQRGAGSAAAYGGTVSLNGRNLNVRSSGIRLDGVISGAGGLVIDTNDSGNPVILNNAGNTFTGNISVSSGSVQSSSGTGIPDGASVILGSNSTFYLGANETINGVTGPSSSSLQAGSYSLTVGAGGSSFTFDGQWQSGTVVKTGAGTMSLNGANTSTGYLRVQGGTVLVNQSCAARIDVQGGGTLGGNGNVFFASIPPGGHIPVDGMIEPGNQGVGTFTISNPLAFNPGAGFNLQIADWNSVTPGVGHDLLVCPNLIFSGASFIVNLDCAGLANFTETAKSFVIAQGTQTLYPPGYNTVTFNVTNFPGAGTWKLGLAGTYDNTLSLYYTPPAGYSTWASSKGLTAENNGPAMDADKDGVSNLMEYYLDGDPLVGSVGILPQMTRDADYVILKFKRLDSAESDVTTQVIDYGGDVGSWPKFVAIGASSAAEDSDGTIVNVVEDGSNPDQIEVRIRRTNETGGRLFARLRVAKP